MLLIVLFGLQPGTKNRGGASGSFMGPKTTPKKEKRDYWDEWRGGCSRDLKRWPRAEWECKVTCVLSACIK